MVTSAAAEIGRATAFAMARQGADRFGNVSYLLFAEVRKALIEPSTHLAKCLRTDKT